MYIIGRNSVCGTVEYKRLYNKETCEMFYKL